jgi:hypothetical protein
LALPNENREFILNLEATNMLAVREIVNMVAVRESVSMIEKAEANTNND